MTATIRKKCRKGHEYTEGSYRISEAGRRICLICKPDTVCSVEDCTTEVHSKCYCQRHYRLFMKYGTPTNKPLDQYEKRGPKIDPSKPRSKAHGGKAVACIKGHLFTPATTEHDATGRQICITCRQEAEVTHCPQGHPYDDENTYYDPSGYKQCRTCRRERIADRRSQNPGPGQGSHSAAKTHCPKGHAYDSANTYRWNRDGKQVRVCKSCQKDRRRGILLKKYSINEDRFNEMLQACDNRCPGCQQPFGEGRRRPDIDHFHDCCESGSCGKCIRGLLCHRCNLLVGHSNDSPETLLNLAQYLLDADKFRFQNQRLNRVLRSPSGDGEF